MHFIDPGVVSEASCLVLYSAQLHLFCFIIGSNVDVRRRGDIAGHPKTQGKYQLEFGPLAKKPKK